MTVTIEHVLVATVIALLFGGTAVVVALLITLHYVVHRRRKELEASIRQLESLSAALGLQLLEALDILRESQPPHLQQRVDNLKKTVYKTFDDYHQGGIILQSLGDLTVGGDVVGRDKASTGSARSEQ